jgi:hypothetical protein
MSRTLLALLGGVIFLTGCSTAPSDPPPPLRKPEITPAAPRALGALAAGTDAAPRPDLSPPGGEVEPDVPSEPGPAAPEGSAPAPEPLEAPEPGLPAPAPGTAL